MLTRLNEIQRWGRSWRDAQSLSVLCVQSDSYYSSSGCKTPGFWALLLNKHQLLKCGANETQTSKKVRSVHITARAWERDNSCSLLWFVCGGRALFWTGRRVPQHVLCHALYLSASLCSNGLIRLIECFYCLRITYLNIIRWRITCIKRRSKKLGHSYAASPHCMS